MHIKGLSRVGLSIGQGWDLTLDGRSHRVEVRGRVRRTIRWYLDEDLVATVTTLRDDVSLEAVRDTGCVIELELGVLRSVGRATLLQRHDTMPGGASVPIGTVGVDLEPDPGSPAARRDRRIREHPWRHATIAATIGLARVVIPLLLGLLVVRLAITLPLPHWNVSWPDIGLPRIPWPAIPWPAIPWPDVHLPSWEPPPWARWVARALRYGWPVLLGLVVAKLQIDRRREQDALKAELRRGDDLVTPHRPPPVPGGGPT